MKQRRLHKAFLRYHDAENWPLLREALKEMGRADLIGPGKQHLVPNWQPAGTGLAGGEGARSGKKHGYQTFTTKGTPIPDASGKRAGFGKSAPALNRPKSGTPRDGWAKGGHGYGESGRGGAGRGKPKGR